jgi:hypothetical protein
MRILLLSVLLAVSGCAGMQTRTQQIEIACESYATSLDALTVANEAGKLTPAQQSAIVNAAGHIAPVCESDTIPTLDSVKMAAFLEAVTYLQTRASAIK